MGVLEKYINCYENNNNYIIEEHTLNSTISEIYEDLVKLDLDIFFVELIANILYEKNIDYLEILTYKKFAITLIEMEGDFVHSHIILNLQFNLQQKNKELLYIEIPSCTVYESYIDKENNVIQELKEIVRKPIDERKYHRTYNTVYKIQSIQHYFSAYFKYFFDNKFHISKCKNCGKYFIPLNRTDEKYCNNASPQNPKKTCKEYGAKKVYRDKLNSDLIKKSHYNTSQYYRMKINRCKKENEREKLIKEFEKYKTNYEKNKNKYNKGKITENDFSNWIIEQKNIKKEGEKDECKRKSKK